MKSLKFYLGFFIIIAFINNLYSQADIHLKYGRISSSSGEKIKVKNLFFENNQFRYNDYQSADIKSINLDNVLKVEKREGSHALEFGLGLALSGMIGAFIGTSGDYYKANPDFKRNYIIGATSVCLGIGLVWGFSQPKYKTVYTNPKYGHLKINYRYPVGQGYYSVNRYDPYPRYR